MYTLPMRQKLQDQLASVFVWDGTRARPSHSRRTPAHFGVEYEEVTFPSAHLDGVPLSGWLIPAVHRAPQGVVVLCHGHTSTRLTMLPKALSLHRNHFTTLVFDFRARGRSGGDACTLGLRETDDVLGAMAFLREHPDTRALPIGILGESLGGAAALLAAARSPDIGAVATEGAFATLEEVMMHRLKLCFGPFSARVGDSCRRLGAEQFAIDVSEITPEEAVSALAPRPFFLIQNGFDVLCPAVQSERLFAAAGNPKTRWIVPGAPHTFAYWVARREYERRVAEFFISAFASP